MSRKWIFTFAGALIGFVVGLSTGVAFEGDAVNGAFVFAPLGGLVGWLVSSAATNELPNSQEDRQRDARVGADDDKSRTNEDDTTNSKGSETFPQGIIIAVFTILGNAWNFQMDTLKYLGLMPTLRAHPWILFTLPFLLALIVPPYTPVYIILGLVAMSFRASPNNDFKAQKPNSG